MSKYIVVEASGTPGIRPARRYSYATVEAIVDEDIVLLEKRHLSEVQEAALKIVYADVVKGDCERIKHSLAPFFTGE